MRKKFGIDLHCLFLLLLACHLTTFGYQTKRMLYYFNYQLMKINEEKQKKHTILIKKQLIFTASNSGSNSWTIGPILINCTACFFLWNACLIVLITFKILELLDRIHNGSSQDFMKNLPISPYGSILIMLFWLNTCTHTFLSFCLTHVNATRKRHLSRFQINFTIALTREKVRNLCENVQQLFSSHIPYLKLTFNN